MNGTDLVKTGVQLPRIESVRSISAPRRLVSVKWATGPRAGRTEAVDLSPLIDTYKFYAPLREDRKLFASIYLINRGSAVAWGDDELDMSAKSIQRLAEELMTADEFRAFLVRMKLTQEAVAAKLGRSKRQLAYYLAQGSLPRLVTMACFGLEARERPDFGWSTSQSVSVPISVHYAEAWTATPAVLTPTAEDIKQKETA